MYNIDDLDLDDNLDNDLIDDADLDDNKYDITENDIVIDDNNMLDDVMVPNDDLLNDNLSDDIQNTSFEIGDPDGSGFIHQTTDQTCAVVSQQMILKEYGIDISEAQLVIDAKDNDWLNQGTKPEDSGKLLELHGVPTHHGTGIENMASELVQGHKVIVGVDSDEIWHNSIFDDLFDRGNGADHAIVVKGFKENELGEPVVVVNDPGKPNGAGVEYPIDQFEDAFEDGGFHYIATNAPPEGFEQEFELTNSLQGVIPNNNMHTDGTENIDSDEHLLGNLKDGDSGFNLHDIGNRIKIPMAAMGIKGVSKVVTAGVVGGAILIKKIKGNKE